MASADDRKETSLRACVAYMLDIDVSEVPTKREANMGQWLALRNLGLVPVASPETFQWPGRFLGLRRDTSTWAIYFGVPPGIVHDPLSEPDGKGDAAMDAAFVLAQQATSLDRLRRGHRPHGTFGLGGQHDQFDLPYTLGPRTGFGPPSRVVLGEHEGGIHSRVLLLLVRLS